MNSLRRLLVLVFLAAASVQPLFAQWLQTNGPFNVNVQALAVSGTNIFAGTTAVSAQDISGKWCAQDNSADCIVINASATSPEVVTAQFLDKGKQYADATGYFRDGKLVLAFRRTNTRDIGFMTFILRDSNTADASTFNPDGSLRWQGVYSR